MTEKTYDLEAGVCLDVDDGTDAVLCNNGEDVVPVDQEKAEQHPDLEIESMEL